MADKKPSVWNHFSIVILLVVVFTGCTTIQPLKVGQSPEVSGNLFSHDRFDAVLKEFVDDRGMVDYMALQDNPGDLEAYYQLIATFSPDSHPMLFPGNNHRLAYWINAYNAAAIKTVLTRYPVESVLDFKTPALFFFLSNKAGFFFFQRLSFGGSTTSLYYLENQVVRKRFNDPRIHFALNCASFGCPRLPRQAFTGELLDEQLDNEARLFLSEVRNFDIDHEKKLIKLSSIFQWYREDFIDWVQRQFPQSEPNLQSYIRKYLTSEKSEALETVGDRYAIQFIPYDWRLNDQGKSD